MLVKYKFQLPAYGPEKHASLVRIYINYKDKIQPEHQRTVISLVTTTGVRYYIMMTYYLSHMRPMSFNINISM